MPRRQAEQDNDEDKGLPPPSKPRQAEEEEEDAPPPAPTTATTSSIISSKTQQQPQVRTSRMHTKFGQEEEDAAPPPPTTTTTTSSMTSSKTQPQQPGVTQVRTSRMHTKFGEGHSTAASRSSRATRRSRQHQSEVTTTSTTDHTVDNNDEKQNKGGRTFRQERQQQQRQRPSYLDPNNDEEEETLDDRPGAIAIGGTGRLQNVDRGTIDLDHHQEDDISTLSPLTAHGSTLTDPSAALPIAAIAAEVVEQTHPGNSNNISEIVAEVLRQQQLQASASANNSTVTASVTAPGAATSSGQPTSSMQTPQSHPPKNQQHPQEAIVLEQKRICGIPRATFLVSLVIFLLLTALGVALGIIMAPGGKEEVTEMPTRAPVGGGGGGGVTPPTTPPAFPPVVIDNDDLTFLFQEQILGKENGDDFGQQIVVSPDGTTMAVAGRNYVRVYRQTLAGEWNVRVGQTLNSEAGQVVQSLDLNQNGNRLVIGVSVEDDVNGGLVYVLDYNGIDSWIQLPNTPLDGGFGWDVAMSEDGTMVAVSSPMATSIEENDESVLGSVKVYAYNNNDNVWMPFGQLLQGNVEGAKFGHAISWSENRLAVKSLGNGGQVSVFEYTGGNDVPLEEIRWERKGQLLEGIFANEEEGDIVRNSLALAANGDVLAIVASIPNPARQRKLVEEEEEPPLTLQQVRVYRFEGCCSWVRMALEMPDDKGMEIASMAISDSGLFLAVSTTTVGTLIYQQVADEDEWQLVSSVVAESSGSNQNDDFGTALSLSGSGNILAVGAPTENVETPGAALVYALDDAASVTDEPSPSPTTSPIATPTTQAPISTATYPPTKEPMTPTTTQAPIVAVATIAPSTTPPIMSPILTPTTQAPITTVTFPPTKEPTSPQPTALPTKFPTKTPTMPPTPDPTSSPTPDPTASPIAATDFKFEFAQQLDGLATGDGFGAYLEFSRDGATMVVAATTFNYAILLEKGTFWEQKGPRITATDGGQFVHRLDVSQDGSSIVFGIPRSAGTVGTGVGRVQVYRRVDGDLGQIGADIVGLEAGDSFGWDVAISDDGSTIACTARRGDPDGKTDAGYVKLYTLDETTATPEWVQLGPTLTGEEAGDQFGRSVALASSGRRVAIGAVTGGGDSRGRVYVYDYSSGDNSWQQVGQSLDGLAALDWQGTSVDLSPDGNYLAVGADGHAFNGNENAGMARVYELVGCCTWTQLGDAIYGEAAGDQLGAGQISLAVNNGQILVAVGANNHNGNSGKAYLYSLQNDQSWALIGRVAGSATDDELGFGVNISSDGSMFAAGAPAGSNTPGYVLIYNVESV